MVASILGGSRAKKILDRGFDRISTHGVMQDYTLQEIKDIINLLVGDGYLEISKGEYPVVKLTQEAYNVLKNKEKVYKNEIIIQNKNIENNELVEGLKNLRHKLAEAENVPPYIVFADKSISEMAKNMPTTISEFMKIKGVGEYKAQKYGKIFIDKIIELQKKETNDTEEDKKIIDKTDKKTKLIEINLQNEKKTEISDIKTEVKEKKITKTLKNINQINYKDMTAKELGQKCTLEAIGYLIVKFMKENDEDILENLKTLDILSEKYTRECRVFIPLLLEKKSIEKNPNNIKKIESIINKYTLLEEEKQR